MRVPTRGTRWLNGKTIARVIQFPYLAKADKAELLFTDGTFTVVDLHTPT